MIGIESFFIKAPNVSFIRAQSYFVVFFFFVYNMLVPGDPIRKNT